MSQCMITEFLKALCHIIVFFCLIGAALYVVIPENPPTELICDGKSLGVSQQGWAYHQKSASWEGRGFYRMKDGETCFVVEVKGEKS